MPYLLQTVITVSNKNSKTYSINDSDALLYFDSLEKFEEIATLSENDRNLLDSSYITSYNNIINSSTIQNEETIENTTSSPNNLIIE